MGNASSAVHMGRSILVEAVKMQARTLISKLIEYVNYHTVPNAGRNLWQRPLSVDTYRRTMEGTVWVGYNPGDVEIIRDCGGMHKVRNV